MTDTSVLIARRTLLAGLGGGLLFPVSRALSQPRPSIALQAVAGAVTLRPGQRPTPIWQLAGGSDAGPLRFKRGETVDVTLTNNLPIPVTLSWVGLDGNPAAEPLTGRPAIASGGRVTHAVTFRHAGTMLADIKPASDDSPSTTGRAVIVTETEPIAVDRDEVLIFQDWRPTTGSGFAEQKNERGDAGPLFTVNGAATADLVLNQNERLRLRLINSSQATVIAIRISDFDVRIMAIDGQPSEPFLARDGLVVLSPGSRVDVFVDAVRPRGSTSQIILLDGREGRPIGTLVTSDAKPVRPAPLPPPAGLPSNGLPAQLDLKSALRVDLPLASAEWLAETALTPTTPPAFKVRQSKTVVLALANRGAKLTVFHLQGHHFRLLDRLDDGWKPFWLDTLAIDAGQTQRIAFAAEFPGLYPLATTATEWGAPRRLRSYLVD